MAKAHQDQVSWPYAPPHFYPQPRSYNIPYQQNRVCQESCCRQTRGPIAYPHSLPTLPPSLPCRPPQETSIGTYDRHQPTSQGRSFVPVNPYLQQNGGHPQSTVHRPIPQGRYDYNDFYRYGASLNNNNINSSNHQSYHTPSLKPNANAYAINNTPHVPDQYTPNCNIYAPPEQETAVPTVPSLDVRQFLATWQDKDDEVFDPEQQQQKSNVQYQPPQPSSNLFKPLDCTKRNEHSLPMYDYNQSQLNSHHHNYYGKPIKTVPNQPLSDTSSKNSSHHSGNSYHPMPIDNDCNYNTPQINFPSHGLVDSGTSQHMGYERRIEKVFNHLGFKNVPPTPSNDMNHCNGEKLSHNMEIKSQQLPNKAQYHLSASLECEDLFDDINRMREERQRNIVHPMRYQENYSQRMNVVNRTKTDVPHVSVKPNTASHLGFPMDEFSEHSMANIDCDGVLKKPKPLPLKKWVQQKQKKSDDDLFPSFNIADSSLDFSSRETVIEKSHIQAPCESEIPPISLNPVETNACNNLTEAIPNVNLDVDDPLKLAHSDFNSRTMESTSVPIDCGYNPLALIPEPVQENSVCAIEPSPKPVTGSSQTISSDDIHLSIASSEIVPKEVQSTNNITNIDSLLLLGEERSKNDDREDTLMDQETVPKEQQVSDNDGKKEEACPDMLVEPEDEQTSSSSNALETIAYMYNDAENNTDCNQSESSSDTTIVKKGTEPSHKLKVSPIKHKTFDVLKFWRYRNRLFPKLVSSRKIILFGTSRQSKPKILHQNRCLREFSKFCVRKRKKLASQERSGAQLKGAALEDNDSEVINVLASIVNGVCQIGEISSQGNELVNSNSESKLLNEASERISEPLDSNKSPYTKFNEFSWELADEKVTSTVESDVTEEEDSNLVMTEEYMELTEGSSVNGSDDGVLQGILNWPHHEEEISSMNDKDNLKVSLPWVKIFKAHSDLSDDKTLEIGPARIELRYSSAPVEYPPGHFKTGRYGHEKKSVFSVKKLLLKRNSSPQTERLPKMVIKKTGCEEYKSYIKDAKLRVVSIKNSKRDGQAEVIIEADRPLIEDGNNCFLDDARETISAKNLKQSSNLSPESTNELHHCLLCQESFTSIDRLHNHENSLSHRHIDIIQRSVLHKLQQSIKGADLPEFQPLSTTEIEYLNWKPTFPGYNHFYHNVPL